MPKEDERTTTAAKAAKAEADEKPILVEYDGVTYEVDRDSTRSIEFNEAAEDNRGLGMSRTLLGRRQWAEFKQKYPGDGGLDAVTGFLDAFGKAVGSGNR